MKLNNLKRLKKIYKWTKPYTKPQTNAEEARVVTLQMWQKLNMYSK